MEEPINGPKPLNQVPVTGSIDLLVFVIYLLCAGIYFSPVFFFGKGLLIEAADHFTTYVRMVQRAHWLRQGIVPLWDPQTFSGISFIDTVPTTHLLNPQAWLMALLGDHLGYNLGVLMLVVFGAFGTYLFCQRRLGIDWRLSLCAGISVAFGPYIGNTYSSIFTLFPFISYFLYYFWVVFQERQTFPVIRAALFSAFPLALCFYTQEPRYLEHIFYSTIILVIIAFIVFEKDRNRIIRNLLIFAPVAAVNLIFLIIPILFPMMFGTFFNQQRLGSGEAIIPILQYPNLPYLANIVLGNLFPINLAIFHDELRLKLLGDYLVFYFEYVHILFYGLMACGLTMYRRWRPIEKCLFWMPVVIILLIYSAPYIPGFMYLWTLLFKTGRFGLESDISNFYGVVAVFLILNKICEGGQVNLQSKTASFARMVFTLQITIAVIAVALVVFTFFFGHSFLLPYIRFHAAALAGTKRVIDPQTIEALFGAIFNSFVQRVPFLLLSFILLAIQILIVKRLIFSRQEKRPLMSWRLLVILGLTPLSLSAAYWPFNNVPDRTETRTADRQFLASLNLIDRVDSADLYTRTDLRPEERTRVISFFSPKSLKWSFGAFPSASVNFIHHFVPKGMYIYFCRMYANDQNFKKISMFPPFKRSYFYPQDNNLFHLLGVNYVFSELDHFSNPFIQIDKYDDYFVYKNVKAISRIYFVDKVTMQRDDKYLLDTLDITPYNELKREGFILNKDCDEGGITTYNFCDNGRKYNLISYTPNTITIETYSPNQEFLVLTDTFDPRWRVYIDGNQTQLYKTNFLFRGVMIPPGKHNINFVYYYPEFIIYLLTSGIYVFIIFIYLKITE